MRSDLAQGRDKLSPVAACKVPGRRVPAHNLCEACCIQRPCLSRGISRASASITPRHPQDSFCKPLSFERGRVDGLLSIRRHVTERPCLDNEGLLRILTAREERVT